MNKKNFDPDKVSRTLRDELMDLSIEHDLFGFSKFSENTWNQNNLDNDKPDFLIRKENIMKNQKKYNFDF